MAAQVQAPRAENPVAAQEAQYYRIETIPIPEGLSLEVGGMASLPDGRLAVITRRGELWLIENPTMTGGARPTFTRFASGLHEPLGLAYRDGDFYASQRSELTRIRDTDGDGKADLYETVYSWPLSGNYHEYSYGPLFTPQGNMLVWLNLGWAGRGVSIAPWRGWTVEITPDGKLTPLATGMRSPAGLAYNLEGDLFYSENQGDWVGSGSITHVEKGDFLGNPAGLVWTSDPASPIRLREADVPNTGEPKYAVAKRVPDLKSPAVWFPHTLLGISTSSILVDSTWGAFGPFAGQLFVGDQSYSRINRVFLEKVDGVYQGAVFSFREGFASGVLRQEWARDGSMLVGMTERGWNSSGDAPFGIQRLVWTGRTPFEAQRIEARPDGFEVVFTLPVDRATASNPASYEVSSFTYRYHSTYGSPVVNQESNPIRAVVVSDDGTRARLVIDGMRLGYVHEIKMAGVRASDGSTPLLHNVGYYTLNRIPAGGRVNVSAAPGSAPAASTSPTPAAGAGASGPATPARVAGGSAGAKRQVTMPADWNGQVDANLALDAVEPLKFSAPELTVKAGVRVRVLFNNEGEMLHNFVVVQPGRADAVATAASMMGLSGQARHYVPDTGDVLYHTAVLEPDRSETIFFRAPTTPGDYPYICSFPGHGFVMRGILRVTP
ncbi:MAG: auracyanin family protein [Gemmatimonadetes bacterium]|nr:auracyanin family protein [Gemmatimonadota bacterium]